MTYLPKKPGVAFWATVTVVMLVVYVASVGPANYLMAKIDGDWPMTIVSIVYSPLWRAAGAGPEWAWELLMDYTIWWTEFA